MIRDVALMVLGILVCQRLGGTTSLILLLVVIATIVVWSGIQGYRKLLERRPAGGKLKS